LWKAEYPGSLEHTSIFESTERYLCVLNGEEGDFIFLFLSSFYPKYLEIIKSRIQDPDIPGIHEERKKRTYYPNYYFKMRPHDRICNLFMFMRCDTICIKVYIYIFNNTYYFLNIYHIKLIKLIILYFSYKTFKIILIFYYIFILY
jgi:hypothetical protein